MAHFPLPEPSASIAAQARATVAELAMAARHGALGGGTVLAYTARLQKLLVTLAAYEEMADEMAHEEFAVMRAREAAARAGEIVELRPRRTASSDGGRAA